MTSNENDQTSLVTQSLTNMNVTPDVHSILPSLSQNSSEQNKSLVVMKLHIYI